MSDNDPYLRAERACDWMNGELPGASFNRDDAFEFLLLFDRGEAARGGERRVVWARECLHRFKNTLDQRARSARDTASRREAQRAERRLSNKLRARRQELRARRREAQRAERRLRKLTGQELSYDPAKRAAQETRRRTWRQQPLGDNLWREQE